MAITDKLSAIADAIRAKTGKPEKLKLDQMPGAIAGIRGGALGQLSVTENGTYEPGYEAASFTWDENTEYDGTITVEDVTLRYKKAANLTVPDDVAVLNDPGYSLAVTLPDGTAEQMPLADLEVVEENGVYIVNGLMYAIVWVKDATLVNAGFGANLEDNTVYVTDFLYLMGQGEMAGASMTLTACGAKLAGFSSVGVNVPIPDGYVKPVGTNVITENGIYNVAEFAQVDVAVESSEGVEKIVYVGMDYDENVKAVNHRGYSTVAPENTLPAYVLSKKNGFTYVEADISFTSDGVPVLLHDSTIDRTSDGSGSISSMTYAQVSKYDFGSWKSADYAGTKIPTFSEFIKLCKNLCLHPYIELKSNGAYTEAQIRGLVDTVEAYGMRGKVTWISFASAFLGYVKEADPNARLGYLVSSITSDTITTVQSLKTETNEVFLDSSDYSAEAIALCIAADIPLEIWTINSKNAIRNMDSYITGVTSDNLHAGRVLYNDAVNPVVTDALINISMGAVGGSNNGAGGNDYAATYSGVTFKDLYFEINGAGYLTVPTDFMATSDPWTIAFTIDAFTPNSSANYGRIARGNNDVPSIFYTKTYSAFQTKVAYSSVNASHTDLELVDESFFTNLDGSVALGFNFTSGVPTTFVFRNNGKWISLWVNGDEKIRQKSSAYVTSKYASTFSIGDNAGAGYHLSYLKCSMLKAWNRGLTDEEICIIS